MDTEKEVTEICLSLALRSTFFKDEEEEAPQVIILEVLGEDHGHFPQLLHCNDDRHGPPETRVVELVGDFQLDAPISQGDEVQVLEGALWKDQGRERVEVAGPENRVVIRVVGGPITELLWKDCHLS